MTDLVRDVAESFGASLSETLPKSLGLWAGGLVWYLTLGSLIAAVALWRARTWSFAQLLGRLFPPHLYRNVTARITAWHFLLYLMFWAPLFALVTITPPLASAAVDDFLRRMLGERETIVHAQWAVVTLQASVIIIAMSFASYLYHYASHRLAILWSFHRAHHSVEALTLPATARDHPLDIFPLRLFMNLFAGIFGGLALYVTGTHLHAMTSVMVGLCAVMYFTALRVFNHTHIPVTLGWFNRIVMAPIMHQLHHSAEMRHRDKNIGSFCGLMIWDWMFGTLYLPTRDEQYRWGLNEDELGEKNPHQRLRDFYLEPFAHAWGVIRRIAADDPRQVNVSSPN